MRALTLPCGVAAMLLLAGTLAACSPKFNWRQYHATAVPFSVLFPDKPQTVTRMVDLDGMHVTMTMTAAEVDGVTFAVGAAAVADTSLAAPALNAMKTAMIRNIHGTVLDESAAAASSTSAGASTQNATLKVNARGRDRAGQPLLLAGHFIARGKSVYQVIVLGAEGRVSAENTDTFLASFRLD